jgi:hypothetical protein
MAELRTVTTLINKRDEIERAIVGYEAKLKAARMNLAHISAAILLLDGTGHPTSYRVSIDLRRLFGYGEMANIAVSALGNSPLSTPETTRHIMLAKGLDVDNKLLSRNLCLSVVQSVRGLSRRRRVKMLTKRGGICVWQTISANDAASSLSTDAKPRVALLT